MGKEVDCLTKKMVTKGKELKIEQKFPLEIIIIQYWSLFNYTYASLFW